MTLVVKIYFIPWVVAQCACLVSSRYLDVTMHLMMYSHVTNATCAITLDKIAMFKRDVEIPTNT